jgi:hypothetical protein
VTLPRISTSQLGELWGKSEKVHLATEFLVFEVRYAWLWNFGRKGVCLIAFSWLGGIVANKPRTQ